MAGGNLTAVSSFQQSREAARQLAGSLAAAGTGPASFVALPLRENFGLAIVPPTVKGKVILPFETLPPARPPKIDVSGLLLLAARLASPW